MISTTETVKWSLIACMRIHGVTIRQLAKGMNVTMKRVREVRAMSEVIEFTAYEYVLGCKAAAK